MDAGVNISQRSEEECNEWYAVNRPDRRVVQGIRDLWQPDGWVDSEDPCTRGVWEGIVCDPVFSTRVIEVDLNNTEIVGDMSAVQWNGLVHLEKLVLSNNVGLQGIIPPGLGNLVNLTMLYLDNCALHGPIPDTFVNSTVIALAVAQMKQAEFDITPGVVSQGQPILDSPPALNFQSNWLNGTIPRSLQSLDPDVFRGNCLAESLTQQRAPAKCAKFYREVAETPPQPFNQPQAFPFQTDPRIPRAPPLRNDDIQGSLVAEYVTAIVTIVVVSVIATLVGGWWYRRRRRREFWKRLPKDEVPHEDWQFEAIAADVPQYSVSKLKQVGLFLSLFSTDLLDSHESRLS